MHCKNGMEVCWKAAQTSMRTGHALQLEAAGPAPCHHSILDSGPGTQPLEWQCHEGYHDVGGPGWTSCMQSASGKLAMIESSPRELAPSIKSLLEAVSGECRMTASRKISQIGFWWMSDN